MGVKVRERPKGSGVWWIFIDHQGERKARKIGKDKRIALEVAKRIEARLILGDLAVFAKGGQNDSHRIPTLREYVFGWKGDGVFVLGWFDKYAKIATKRSTWTNYKVILEKHILPSMGDQGLDQIT